MTHSGRVAGPFTSLVSLSLVAMSCRGFGEQRVYSARRDLIAVTEPDLESGIGLTEVVKPSSQDEIMLEVVGQATPGRELTSQLTDSVAVAGEWNLLPYK
jgi:hypothetical protein